MCSATARTPTNGAKRRRRRRRSSSDMGALAMRRTKACAIGPRRLTTSGNSQIVGRLRPSLDVRLAGRADDPARAPGDARALPRRLRRRRDGDAAAMERRRGLVRRPQGRQWWRWSVLCAHARCTTTNTSVVPSVPQDPRERLSTLPLNTTTHKNPSPI